MLKQDRAKSRAAYEKSLELKPGYFQSLSSLGTQAAAEGNVRGVEVV